MSILSDIAGKIKERVDAETAARGAAFAALQAAHDASIVTFDAAVEAAKNSSVADVASNTTAFNTAEAAADAELAAAAAAVRSNVEAGIDSITEAVSDMNTKGDAIQASINSNTTAFNDALAAHEANLGDDSEFAAGFAEGAA